MITFSIPKMNCGGCAKSVTNVLHQIDETASVTIDLDKKEVAFEGAASQQDALNALEAAGYPATITQ